MSDKKKPYNRLDNLVPVTRLTKSEARQRSINGGKKSGEARRNKKTMRETLKLLLESGSTKDNVTLALIEKALMGDVKAYEVIRDTMGENPTQKQEIIGSIPVVIGGDSELKD